MRDELNNLLSKLNENVNGTISVQGYVDILSEGLSIILPDILNQIAELDARLKVLEQAFFTRTDIKMPPTGPIRFGPVLNDGKPTPTLCPHCSEPMVCSNPICTGRALPDQEEATPTDEDKRIKWAIAKLEKLVLRDEPSWTEKEIVDILRQLIAEVRR